VSQHRQDDNGTLSDRFLAHCAMAATHPRAASLLAKRLTLKLTGPEGRALSPEKREDMQGVIDWLRLCAGEISK